MTGANAGGDREQTLREMHNLAERVDALGLARNPWAELAEAYGIAPDALAASAAAAVGLQKGINETLKGLAGFAARVSAVMAFDNEFDKYIISERLAELDAQSGALKAKLETLAGKLEQLEEDAEQLKNADLAEQIKDMQTRLEAINDQLAALNTGTTKIATDDVGPGSKVNDTPGGSGTSANGGQQSYSDARDDPANGRGVNQSGSGTSANGGWQSYSDARDGDGNNDRDHDSGKGRDKGDGFGGHCFTGETPILLEDGTTKPISEIVVGDRVASFDGFGALGASSVTRVFRHEPLEE